MSAAARRAAWFVALGLLIHVALGVGYAATVGRRHEVRRMDARWLAGPRPARVMIAGDSHARFGVEAPRLGAAINVAVPGEHYEKSMYRVPWLLDHGTRRVGAVLLPFDAASFSSFKRDAFAPELLWGRYVDYWALGRRKGALWTYGGFWAKARFAPYVGEMETVLQLATSARHFRDPRDPTQSGLGLAVFENGTLAARRHFAGADPFDPDMVHALRSLIDDLVGRGIRVVLVRYPVTALYARESRRLGADPALRDALLAELERPGVVDHLDFESLFFREPELFGDGDHLNAVGKRRLTDALAPELVRLGVLPEAPL